MNTSEKDKCKRCGAAIPAKSTEKLCPACLMSGALEPLGGKFETVSMAPGESLSLYGPSELPCEFGGYRLLGLLGRGGMGTVYEAEEIATGRRVALKMLGQQLDSPEQLRGDTLDLRADIYSVGATLFTLLTNRAPFEGDNAVQVVANAVKEKPKPLT